LIPSKEGRLLALLLARCCLSFPPSRAPPQVGQPPLYRLVSKENIPYNFAKGDIFMPIHDEIGDTIVLLRKQRGYTQEHLALECEISVSYLRRIEHGDANPTINELWRIAEVLDVELRNPFEDPLMFS